MSVARTLGPQVLDAPLRPAQQPVDVATVSVGCYLRRDLGRQAGERLGQRAIHPEDALEDRKAHLHLLADRQAPVRFLGGQEDDAPRQFLPNPLPTALPGAGARLPAASSRRRA